MSITLKPFDEDTVDPEAVAEVIGDLLVALLPPDKRAAALAIAVKAEDADRAEREANGGFAFKIFDAGELQELPGPRHWNSIMRLKARLVYVFVRNITNNHSKADAGQLLFQRHRYAPGSGYLEEYLDGLPQSHVPIPSRVILSG